MADRIEVYSGEELVGTVPRPHMAPNTRDFVEMILQQPFTLGLERHSIHDIAASAVEFKVVWRDCNNGWGKKATLVCSPMYGPGDWECIPGFVYEEPHTSRGRSKSA